MSTITVSNIKATGETASRAVSGVAAAWVNFNGTGTIAVRDSVNVASLTDSGSGKYLISFSNSFGAVDYCNNVTTRGVAATFSGLGSEDHDASRSVSNLSVYSTRPDTLAVTDSSSVSMSAHGDLA